MELIKFISQDEEHFLGAMFAILVVCYGISKIVRAFRD